MDKKNSEIRKESDGESNHEFYARYFKSIYSVESKKETIQELEKKLREKEDQLFKIELDEESVYRKEKHRQEIIDMEKASKKRAREIHREFAEIKDLRNDLLTYVNAKNEFSVTYNEYLYSAKQYNRKITITGGRQFLIEEGKHIMSFLSDGDNWFNEVVIKINDKKFPVKKVCDYCHLSFNEEKLTKREYNEGEFYYCPKCLKQVIKAEKDEAYKKQERIRKEQDEYDKKWGY